MGSAAPEPAPPIRLAILDCDTPVPAVAAKYGGTGYSPVFRQLLTAAVAPQPLDSAFAITEHDVVRGDPETVYPRLDDVDALLLTGSKHNAFDDDAWIVRLVEFTRSAIAGGRVRVVGICFGHQIVARALGVPVGRNPAGWEVSVTEVKLSEKGREVFQQDTLFIHQMHRDVAFSLPAGAESLAATDPCPVQGMLIPGRVITVQGHPEFNEGIMRAILDLRKAILPEDVWRSAAARATDRHDGVAIARAFVRFMRE